MIILKQFDGGAVSPRDDAILYNAIIKNSGVFSGMDITHLGANQILIKEGRGIIKGRVWEHTEETVYCNLSTSGQMKGRLFLHMDLSNLEEPLAIKSIVSETLPELRQDENCNYINGIYEIELCTYDVNDIRISNLQITFPILEDAFPIAKTREETLAVTRDDVLASAQVVGGLYSDLGGFHPVIDVTGRITGYKTTVGADTVFPFSGTSIIMCENAYNSYHAPKTTMICRIAEGLFSYDSGTLTALADGQYTLTLGCSGGRTSSGANYRGYARILQNNIPIVDTNSTSIMGDFREIPLTVSSGDKISIQVYSSQGNASGTGYHIGATVIIT